MDQIWVNDTAQIERENRREEVRVRKNGVGIDFIRDQVDSVSTTKACYCY